MSWVGVAVAGGSVASGLAGTVGSLFGSSQQSSAQKSATNLQRTIYSNNQAMEQPFLTAGQGATTALAELLGVQSGSYGDLPNGYLTQQKTAPFSFDPSSITSSPGYQFAQNQGMQQVQNSAAASQGAMSGAALKALTNFSTGTAEQYFNDYYNQALNNYTTNFNTQQTSQNNIFNRLSALAGLGQNAAAQTGNTGAQIGSGIAQSTAATGASNAAGTVGAANSIGNALSGASNGYALSSILSANGTPGSTGGYNFSTGLPSSSGVQYGLSPTYGAGGS